MMYLRFSAGLLWSCFFILSGPSALASTPSRLSCVLYSANNNPFTGTLNSAVIKDDMARVGFASSDHSVGYDVFYHSKKADVMVWEENWEKETKGRSLSWNNYLAFKNLRCLVSDDKGAADVPPIRDPNPPFDPCSGSNPSDCPIHPSR
jgi:hypothetical protein